MESFTSIPRLGLVQVPASHVSSLTEQPKLEAKPFRLALIQQPLELRFQPLPARRLMRATFMSILIKGTAFIFSGQTQHLSTQCRLQTALEELIYIRCILTAMEQISSAAAF